MALFVPPSFRPFADLQVQVGIPQDVGPGPHGHRRVVPILGGQVQGVGWTARVLPGGADFQLLLSDTLAELDARYVLETEAGELIYVHNHALRRAEPETMARLVRGERVDPAQVYFRCAPRFETSAPALRWITERLFIGSGVREPSAVLMRFHELL